jgi:hypothetical protein
MVMSPVGLGTENDCAGEDQQQFNRPTEPTPPLVKEEYPIQNIENDHPSRRGPQRRMAVLSKTSSKLPLCSKGSIRVKEKTNSSEWKNIKGNYLYSTQY